MTTPEGLRRRHPRIQPLAAESSYLDFGGGTETAGPSRVSQYEEDKSLRRGAQRDEVRKVGHLLEPQEFSREDWLRIWDLTLDATPRPAHSTVLSNSGALLQR